MCTMNTGRCTVYGDICDIFTIVVEPLTITILIASRDYRDINTCFCACAHYMYLCKRDKNYKPLSVYEV